MPPADGRFSRRSLTLRDGQYMADARESSLNKSFPKALYDIVHYVVNTAIRARDNGPSSLQALVFAKDSWLPDRSLGYAPFLSPFVGLRSIHFTSPFLPEDVPLSQNMEGWLAPLHLHALALYLNTPSKYGYPCRFLQRVHIEVPAPVSPGTRLPKEGELSLAFNSPERLHVGVPYITVFVILV